ncbi:MAG TPA: lipase family protein [Kofleriaceae bacterium]|nr:lipase family protein [Kofleriaceae bacterium]
MASCGHPMLAGSPDAAALAGDARADARADAAPAPAATCVESGQVDPFTPVAATLTLPQDKGRILACEHVETVTAAQLSANSVLAALGLTAANGYDHFIIQYVSEGPIGTARRVTASVYVPDGAAQQVTLVAVNHGTSGMGQPCGPSHDAAAAADLDKLTLPAVSQGYAVVATDYQGMGVAGEPISPYTVGHAEALAILDGVRAMWQFHATQFDASQLSRRLFLLGHSQGGQATLFAHQDFDDSVGGQLLGSVSFAPAVGDERGYKYLLGTSAAPTNVAGVVLAMVLYGHAIYYGTATSSLLTDSAATALPQILASDCITDLDTAIPAAEPTIGQMFAPAFVAGAASCNLDGTACPAFEPWNSELLADEPGSFQSAAPTLILQGGEDTTVPAPFTACIQARLAAQNPGAPDLACLYATATHPTIVVAAMVDALGWMHSVAGGSAPFLCPQLVPLPAECAPL